MKKSFLTILIITGVVIACSKKVAPTTTTTQPPETNVVKEDDIKAHQGTEMAAMIAEGKTVYTARCQRCHVLRTVENYTVTQWSEILKRMAPKAKLTEMETQQVSAYVTANAKK